MDCKNINLETFLEYKTLYYDKIDFTIIKKSWDVLSKEITLPFVIHIVGTNGKGSTGRFLSHYLHKKKYKVLHYSSPHILKFNERIWINGSDISDDELELAHNFLQKLFSLEILEKLTYFEYTTLLALYLCKDMDYIVLEAGLGGEFDATNVVLNDISLITTIGLDHQKFLGNSVYDIASTKIKSVDKKMIVAYQEHKEVFSVAKKIAKQKNLDLIIVDDFSTYNFGNKFASYLQKNLYLVIKCLEELSIDIDLSLFDDLVLKGRFEKFSSNIIIDVGHNPLAAKALKNELKDKKVTLVYNSYDDKDYKEVLNILKENISEIYLIPLDDKRIVDIRKLKEVVNRLNIKIIDKLKIDTKKQYLVFGSFLVVEKFLKVYKN